MLHQAASMSTTVKPPSLIGKKRRARTFSEMTLMRKAESEAFSYFKRYYDSKNVDPKLEERFLTAIKESPSAITVDLGILFAVEAGWYKALEDLLSIDVSVYTPVESDGLRSHPLRNQSLSLFTLPTPSPARDERHVDMVLLYAVIFKKVKAIEILAKHFNFNVNDISGKPSLHYVYSLNDQKAQKQIIDIILSGLRPSFENLCAAAEHGDLESTKYITKKLHPDKRYFIPIVGMRAIQNGHDDVAKWLAEIPEIIGWNEIGSYLVGAAAERDNFDLIEFFAKHSTALPLETFGYYAASKLWTCLKKRDRLDLFEKFLLPYLQSFEELFMDA
jgi:hypothetical protein